MTFGKESEQQYNLEIEKCEKITDSLTRISEFDQLSPANKASINSCEENYATEYWDIEGPGCSWYCGGGPDSITASSYLQNQGENNYIPKNAHDLSYKNAWCEGEKGYGAGEYLTYYFHTNSPRITTINVVNGYVKSKSAFYNNSRVKSLKVYINDKPFAILHLEDGIGNQSFHFDPIGFINENDNEPTQVWTLKFEILEVYTGKKYDDTLITEIYFDGIDVH